jgi:hypothetical protein
MWASSCAITPWSSSRESRSRSPVVTATDASSGRRPAAKAFNPGVGITYALGGGTPAAIAISSTTLRNCRWASAPASCAPWTDSTIEEPLKYAVTPRMA